jgi:hypothetical protein
MRVGPLPNGRVLLTLSDEQAKVVDRVRDQRESVKRTGTKGPKFAPGRDTHFEGALTEVALCAYYDVPFKPVRGSDGGRDLRLGSKTVQVKSRPWVPRNPRRNLQVPEWEWQEHQADMYYQMITYGKGIYSAQLVGYATRAEMEQAMVVSVTVHETGREIPTRRIPEGRLHAVSYRSVVEAMDRYNDDSRDKPIVSLQWGYSR